MTGKLIRWTRYYINFEGTPKDLYCARPLMPYDDNVRATEVEIISSDVLSRETEASQMPLARGAT